MIYYYQQDTSILWNKQTKHTKHISALQMLAEWDQTPATRQTLWDTCPISYERNAFKTKDPWGSGIRWNPHRSLPSQTDCQTKFSSSKSTGLDANNCGQTFRHTHKQTNSLYHRSEITANVNNTWQCLILTLWRPLLPYRYSYKASCARPC